MIVKQNIWFSPANEQRRLHIYLPKNYRRNKKERYPVLYMFDGHNLFYKCDTTYGTTWGLKQFLDTWHKDIIIVGLECNHKGNGRLIEFCPYFWDSFAGKIFGTGKETLQWMVSDLKPYIDATYRTWSHREATGLAGSSMGGLMSLYGAIAHNDTFSKAGCLSSAISFCGKELRHEIASHTLAPDTKVFLSWGAFESNTKKGKAIASACNKSINDRLYKKGVQPYLFRQEDGGHCEKDWARQVPLFMNWLWC